MLEYNRKSEDNMLDQLKFKIKGEVSCSQNKRSKRKSSKQNRLSAVKSGKNMIDVSENLVKDYWF